MTVAATRRQGCETVDSHLVLVVESLYAGIMDQHEHRKNMPFGGVNRW